jgi:hypothetical protein
MFAVPTQCPINPRSQTDPVRCSRSEGNCSLRRRHRRVFYTDATDPCYDHRRRHVVFFIGSRYL